MLEYENELYKKGITLIAGIDEVGRGPLVGPVVTAAVILPVGFYDERIQDSKKLTEKKRELLYDVIMDNAISVSIGMSSNEVIDEINILEATKKGLTLAVKDIMEQLKRKPDIIVVDALREINTFGIEYQSIIKGDSTCYSIACASILAKVTRDRIMKQWDEVYPEYGFAKHKGYGTVQHIGKIKEIGPCVLHRKSFIKNFIK